MSRRATGKRSKRPHGYPAAAGAGSDMDEQSSVASGSGDVSLSDVPSSKRRNIDYRDLRTTSTRALYGTVLQLRKAIEDSAVTNPETVPAVGAGTITPLTRSFSVPTDRQGMGYDLPTLRTSKSVNPKLKGEINEEYENFKKTMIDKNLDEEVIMKLYTEILKNSVSKIPNPKGGERISYIKTVSEWFSNMSTGVISRLNKIKDIPVLQTAFDYSYTAFRQSLKISIQSWESVDNYLGISRLTGRIVDDIKEKTLARNRDLFSYLDSLIQYSMSIQAKDLNKKLNAKGVLILHHTFYIITTLIEIYNDIKSTINEANKTEFNKEINNYILSLIDGQDYAVKSLINLCKILNESINEAALNPENITKIKQIFRLTALFSEYYNGYKVYYDEVKGVNLKFKLTGAELKLILCELLEGNNELSKSLNFFGKGIDATKLIDFKNKNSKIGTQNKFNHEIRFYPNALTAIDEVSKGNPSNENILGSIIDDGEEVPTINSVFVITIDRPGAKYLHIAFPELLVGKMSSNIIYQLLMNGIEGLSVESTSFIFSEILNRIVTKTNPNDKKNIYISKIKEEFPSAELNEEEMPDIKFKEKCIGESGIVVNMSPREEEGPAAGGGGAAAGAGGQQGGKRHKRTAKKIKHKRKKHTRKSNKKLTRKSNRKRLKKTRKRKSRK